MNRPEVRTFGMEKEMADFLIRKWKEIAQISIKKKEYFAVAVSGGHTPIHLYRRMAARKEILPWDKTHIFMVDERFVPFCHADSNFQMVKITLLNPLEIPVQNLHPIRAEEATPQIAAEKYEEELRTFFQPAAGQFPEFDLILLGIGGDGHTASLFPGGLGFDTPKFSVAVYLNQEKHNRITLTLPVINQAKHVIFYATGKNKAGIMKKVVEERDPSFPASRVAPQTGNLLFLLDLEASSQLSLTSPQPRPKDP